MAKRAKQGHFSTQAWNMNLTWTLHYIITAFRKHFVPKKIITDRSMKVSWWLWLSIGFTPEGLHLKKCKPSRGFTSQNGVNPPHYQAADFWNKV